MAAKMYVETISIEDTKILFVGEWLDYQDRKLEATENNIKNQLDHLLRGYFKQ